MKTYQITKKKARPKPIFIVRRFKKYIANGSTGSGKSTFLEFLAEIALKKGCIVWDLWAAGVYENCFWCIPGKKDPERKYDPYARRVGYPVLIIHPKNLRIEPREGTSPLCTCGRPEPEHDQHFKLSCLNMEIRRIRCKRFVPLIMTITDDKPLSEIVKIVLSENRKYKRVIVFNEGFYDDLGDAYRKLAKILKDYPTLIKRKIIPRDVPNCMIFRELGDLATGGVKSVTGQTTQTAVRREIQNLMRKPRHWHVHIMGDAQRNEDIASAVAEQKDYWIIKRATEELIPERYKPKINRIEMMAQKADNDLDFANMKRWVPVNKLQAWQCYILHPDDTIEFKTSRQPGFMHKGEFDDWEELAGVEIKYGKENEDLSVSNPATELDKERIKVLQEAYEIHEKEGISYPKIAIDDRMKERWSKFGKPDSLQRAVKRAISEGEINPV